MIPISQITDNVKKVQKGHTGRSVMFSDDTIGGNNEYLFFIKPELTMKSQSINLDEILEMIVGKIEEYGLRIRNIILLPSHYLKKYNIIAGHYGVINAIARDAKANLSAEAKLQFQSLFDISLREADVLGGLEFGTRYNELSATAIDYLWQNTQVKKLGGGAYAGMLTIDGQQVILANGFHPRQLEHFVAPSRSIIAITLCGNTRWSIARNKLIGKTNPNDAEPGSIRRTLLEHKEKFGLPAINQSWNGVHLSAGPVEALVELIRYNSDFSTAQLLNFTDFSFGKLLASEFSTEQIGIIMTNPEVTYEGKKSSIFDLTEEYDSDNALSILKKVQIR
jgi:hypothetical protein